MAEHEHSTAIELALAQSKKVEREVRILKQQLARLRENLQSKETQGNGSRNGSK